MKTPPRTTTITLVSAAAVALLALAVWGIWLNDDSSNNSANGLPAGAVASGPAEELAFAEATTWGAEGFKVVDIVLSETTLVPADDRYFETVEVEVPTPGQYVVRFVREDETVPWLAGMGLFVLPHDTSAADRGSSETAMTTRAVDSDLSGWQHNRLVLDSTTHGYPVHVFSETWLRLPSGFSGGFDPEVGDFTPAMDPLELVVKLTVDADAVGPAPALFGTGRPFGDVDNAVTFHGEGWTANEPVRITLCDSPNLPTINPDPAPAACTPLAQAWVQTGADGSFAAPWGSDRYELAGRNLAVVAEQGDVHQAIPMTVYPEPVSG